MLKISHVCIIFLSARILEKARVQLQEDIIRIQSQLLEEKKKREQHEALVRRLQKRVLLLTKVRSWLILGKAFPSFFPLGAVLFLLCSPP